MLKKRENPTLIHNKKKKKTQQSLITRKVISNLTKAIFENFESNVILR